MNKGTIALASSSTPHGDGVEEVECHACGTITSLQIVPSSS